MKKSLLLFVAINIISFSSHADKVRMVCGYKDEEYNTKMETLEKSLAENVTIKVVPGIVSNRADGICSLVTIVKTQTASPVILPEKPQEN